MKNIKVKNKLLRNYKLTRTESSETKYKMHKAILDKSLKTAENDYYKDIFDSRSSSANSLWKYVSPILNGKKKQPNEINKLKIGDNLITVATHIANYFNDHFCSVGQKLAQKIQSDDNEASYKSYLKKETSILDSFFLSPTTETDVLEEILKLNPKKCGGPDGLKPKLVRESAYYLAKPLSVIFHSSIKSGIYPSIFKIAKVKPIYKSGERCDTGNYRPISLLNCLNKVFEKQIHKQLTNFLHKNKVIFLYQFGFREKHSAGLALIEIIDHIKECLDKGNYVLGLYLDLQKAFDTIDHSILLGKLNHYGVRGHSLSFFKSYLTNRQQFVYCNGEASKLQTLSHGVPQGSVLGPLLFLIYINDINNCTSDSEFRLLADDTANFKHHANLNTSGLGPIGLLPNKENVNKKSRKVARHVGWQLRPPGKRQTSFKMAEILPNDDPYSDIPGRSNFRKLYATYEDALFADLNKCPPELVSTYIDAFL